MSILKSCDYNIITSNFEMLISSFIKEIEEIKEEKEEIYRIYNTQRDNNKFILSYSNSILIYSILLNQYKENYEISSRLRSLFDNYFDKIIVEMCIDKINNYNNNKPVIITRSDSENYIQKRRVCSPITILNCGDNNRYNDCNSNNSTPRKIRKIDCDFKINICDNNEEDIDYLNCYNNSDDGGDSLCSLFC